MPPAWRNVKVSFRPRGAAIFAHSRCLTSSATSPKWRFSQDTKRGVASRSAEKSEISFRPLRSRRLRTRSSMRRRTGPTGSIFRCAALAHCWTARALRERWSMLNKTPRACFDELDSAAVEALRHGRLADPFAFLGPHETLHGRVIRTFLPGAE